jgi:hypothetical protein
MRIEDKEKPAYLLGYAYVRGAAFRQAFHQSIVSHELRRGEANLFAEARAVAERDPWDCDSNKIPVA